MEPLFGITITENRDMSAIFLARSSKELTELYPVEPKKPKNGHATTYKKWGKFVETQRFRR